MPGTERFFELSDALDEESLFILLGRIDDVDEVYLNGKLIGTTGGFPPLVRTAYQVLRKYPLPLDLLNRNGKNTIAVRVFDEYLDGGIYSGPVGIYYDQDNDLLSLNLAGYWDFETVSPVKNNSHEIYNQQDGKIYVPGFWESRGYSEYDGTAVYSTIFRLPGRFKRENIMLVLGYIDDSDKVYINGIYIGSVKNIRYREDKELPDYLIFRGYEIPDGTLKPGALNTIKVKVYDTGGIMGGIYEGPVGLITEKNFELLKKQQLEKPYNVWDSFFKSIFE